MTIDPWAYKFDFRQWKIIICLNERFAVYYNFIIKSSLPNNHVIKLTWVKTTCVKIEGGELWASRLEY